MPAACRRESQVRGSPAACRRESQARGSARRLPAGVSGSSLQRFLAGACWIPSREGELLQLHHRP